MKTMTIPAVRVEPALREEMESLLAEGETLSQFVESSVRTAVLSRRAHADFVARGLRSLQQARRSGQYVDADTAIAALQSKLDAARKRVQAGKR